MLRPTLTALALILLVSGAAPIRAADEAPKRASLGEVWSVAYSPDGRTLATGSGAGSEPGRLVLWDVATAKPRFWLEQPLGVRSVAFSPDGEKVAAGGWDKTVLIYEARTGKSLATLKGHTDAVNSVAFSPDGKTLASGSLDKTVILWDVAKGTETHKLAGHDDWVLSVAFFPDGKSLASSGKDAVLRVWDVETGKERQVLKDPAAPRPFESTAVSPDGKTIAVGSWDTAVYLWDVDKGAIRATLRGHAMGILSMNYSADGKTLASVSGDYNKQVPGEVKLWSLPDGDETASWSAHADSVWSVRFAPDGRTLATASRDHTVKIWELATGKERAMLENGLVMFDAKLPPPLTEKELDELWSALAAADGAAAQRAMGRLARAPGQTAPWLAERLKPAAKATAQLEKSVREWTSKLDDDDFDTREKAAAELAKLGEAAGPALQKALDDASSAEARKRISDLLKKLGAPGTNPELLRELRAVEVLEGIDTPEARKVLEKLAGGAPGALLTREAAASNRRLAKRR